LRPRSLSAPHRSMLPWALDRHASDAAALSRRPDVSVLDVSPRGSNRFGVPDPKSRRKARSLGLVWLLRPVLTVVPKVDGSPVTVASSPKAAALRSSRPCPEGRTETGRVWLRCVPEGGTSAASQTGPEGTGGMPVDPPRGENPPRRSAHPKALGSTKSRRAPEGTPSRPNDAPKSVASGSSFASPSFRGRPRT